jgi:uncharacterized protein YcbK (DUF882 family)
MAATAGMCAPGLGMAEPLLSAKPRQVDLHNLHTGESLSAVYWENGAYVPDALTEVNRVLRDYRTGDVHRIEPTLVDLLDRLSARTEVKGPFQVISGYRSPRTNAMLHERSDGVAKHSLHMEGMAIDIRHPDLQLASLHRAALEMSVGGVGYYPESNFVHVDVGPVRRWQGV